mmetsp:Transcript_18322/g.38290  ORF Transcript_18322/g.38290 Transcript_18322/m.38290 type:complete len:142 (+) Transcript_18322:151-576(+)
MVAGGSPQDQDLSEPYSVFTYRYFIAQWPQLCFLAMKDGSCVGCIVCKAEVSKRGVFRGYIAMLAVRHDQRKQGIGRRLVQRALDQMRREGCKEILLETEVTNKGALRLYESLGFIRDKRLEKHYLNGSDAFRLKKRVHQC